MLISKVLKVLKKNGFEMTRQNLYRYGQKYKFLTKPEGARYYDFNEDNFNKFLENAKEKVPSGYLTVREISEKTGIPVQTLYYYSKFPASGIKYIGMGRGKLYGNIKQIKEFIRSNKGRDIRDFR